VPSEAVISGTQRALASAAEPPSADFLASIPRSFARQHLVISAGRLESSERLIIAPSTEPWVPGNIAVALGIAVQVAVGDPEWIAQQVDRVYAEATDDAGVAALTGESRAEADAAKVLRDLDQDLLRVDGKGPVIRLVDLILFEALTRLASDVHIQPLSDRTLVRYRVDGVLFDVRELPASLASAVISRIKVMGQMDVAERGAAQDGRATVTIGGSTRNARGETAAVNRSVDLRISTLPTSYGERAVIRLLDTARGQHLTELPALGMPADVQSRFLDRVGRAHGIVLVTGPTGSGKTTTLYATLRLVATPSSGRKSGEFNIMTIEDPIEYELSTVGLAISQTQANPKKGLTFANGLRHILRQDPDVVMIGEIRDAETARMALQASLTGHMVLSTLHTNDAATAVTRLIDLGVERYLVGASLSAVLAQRLLRKTHGTCRGAGCEACMHSGFSGRVGAFELLVVSDKIRERISAGADEPEIRELGRRGGMRTLMEEGERLIREGVTTAVEVQRVIQGLE
jgi:general secretion pathway protein E